MHRIFRVKAYEAEHGPHFNEEHARKAVSKMENEDGTRGPHWSVEETTAASELANCCCTTQRSIAKCDEEMAKCQALLNRLGINDKPAKENDEIIALQKEVNELKNIIRKANQMVPPPMKEMLPQDMKNAMDKVGQ